MKARDMAMSENQDPMVCYCGRVTRSQIIAAIRAGAKTLKEIQKVTGAGVGNRCRELNPKGVCCIPDIVAIIEGETGATGSAGCSCPNCRSDR